MKKGQKKTQNRLKRPKPFFDKRSKRWIAKVYVGNGKYRTRSCRSKDECHNVIDELWSTRSTVAQHGQMTVKDARDLWLKRGEWKAKTISDYTETSDKFAPIFDIPIDLLSTVHVNELLDSFDSSAMRKRVRKVLGTLLQFCIRRKLVNKNVAAETEPVKHERQLIEVFDHGEPQTVFAAMTDRWSPPTELMFRLALRPGEVWGLHWRDWKGRQLTISRNVKEVNGQQVVETTKTTAGNRTLLLDDHAIKLLTARKEEAQKRNHFKPTMPIFATTTGVYQRQSNYRNKVWRPALEAADLEYRVPYTLRHTSVTWMLNSGRVSLAAVSKWIGHKTIDTTLRHYAHLMVGEFEQVANFWSELGANDA